MNYSQDIKQQIFNRGTSVLAGFYKYLTLFTLDINIFVSSKIYILSVKRTDFKKK